MDYDDNVCYFCTETSQLIPMDTNSLIIDSVYIDFAQLILELMQIKVNKNLQFCYSCFSNIHIF